MFILSKTVNSATVDPNLATLMLKKKNMSAWVCNLFVYVCTLVHMYACTCMHTCTYLYVLIYIWLQGLNLSYWPHLFTGCKWVLSLLASRALCHSSSRSWRRNDSGRRPCRSNSGRRPWRSNSSLKPWRNKSWFLSLVLCAHICVYVCMYMWIVLFVYICTLLY